MPTRVLILENDLTFANELADGLRSLGAETTVVEDPSQGLQLATTERPHLIVLAVELHKMNGFSVCSRIKKESTLAAVPVVLVTSNSTDVTIEQHRQRPNHADDYVRKPIAISALIDRLRKYVALTPSTRPSAPPGDDEIIIDDEVLELDSNRPPSMRPRSSIIPADSDVSTFTDNAFDGMMTESPTSVAPRQRQSTALGAARRPSLTPSADTIPNSSPSAAPLSVAPNSESTRVRVRVLEDALDEANTKIQDLESRDLSAKEAELEAVRRELDDARAKLMIAGRGGTPSGSTAREVLDLREQLHKKEKELLDLRDRLTQREKEALNLKDTSLGFEREKADLSDRLDDIARQLAETQRHAEAARSDKETAAKRAEDAKRRIEKLTSQIEEKAQEIDQQRALHDAALNEHATEKSRWVEEYQAAERRAADDLRSAMARASAEINAQAEKAQLQLEQSLAAAEQQARERTELALAEAKTAGESQLQSELENLRQELAELRATELLAQERELTARLAKEHAAVHERAETAHTAELQRMREDNLSALARAQVDLDTARQKAHQEVESAEQERDQRIGKLQREHDERIAALQQERDERDQRIAALQQERDERDQRIAALQQERDERDQRIAALQQERDERDQRIAALQQERDERDQRIAALQQERDERDQRIAALQQERDERDQRIGNLQRDAEEAGKRLVNLQDHNVVLERQTERAQSKWAEDRVNIERTKDALAAALVQLEAIEQRGLETS